MLIRRGKKTHQFEYKNPSFGHQIMFVIWRGKKTSSELCMRRGNEGIWYVLFKLQNTFII